jgi:hydroxymethylglutaryl-CoA synthase
MKLGIDCISFYTPHYYLDLATLAAARGVDVDKYKVGLGQDKMAVTPPDEDIVTFAANAAYPLLKQVDVEQIDTVFLATESGIDQSKAAGIFVHHLLNLPKNCRVVEVKQACYSATAALQMALSYVARNPKRKVLIIASDIARYSLACWPLNLNLAFTRKTPWTFGARITVKKPWLMGGFHVSCI